MTANRQALIDRNIFFGNPQITGGQISPDGKYLSFIKEHEGILNVWIKTIDSEFDDAFPITEDKNRPVRSYFWSRDSKYLIYAQDKGGDENYSLFRIDPSLASKGNIPEALELTPYPGTNSYVLSLPKKYPDRIMVAINDRDKAWHDYYSIEIETGKRRLIYKNTQQLNSIYFDLHAKVKLAGRSLPDGSTEILAVKPDRLERIFHASLEESVSPVKFRRDGKVYFVSNIGDVDLTALYLYDPENNSFEHVESDPDGEADLENASFSIRTDELIATIYIADKKRIYWKNEEYERDYNYLCEQFPGSEISINSVTRDERQFLFYVATDKDPGSAYFFDRDSREIKFLYSPRPELPKESLVDMKPVRYRSLDGLEIPAYLSLPDTEDKTNLPAVIFVHGGPWARDYWGYNGFVQFLCNRNYAVLQVNFRGSTGYGKKFLNAAINQWGEKMQDDLTAGYHYLVDQGIADASKVAIMGGSYGGYATLAGLCFTPDIYAAGVSIVGPSNLFTLLETIPPYWESARAMFHKRMGDPTTEEGRAQLKRQSPFFHADKIKAPLLVAQGANDPRVKKSESDQIVIAMRDQGLAVEYLNFPDEGHGFARAENNLAFISVLEAFLSDQLGGRCQESVSNEIKDIVDNVKVDISQLKMPEIIATEVLHRDMPQAHTDILDENFIYTVSLEIADQKVDFEINRKLNTRQGHLEIEDSSNSAMGSMTDRILIDPNTYSMMERMIEQEPVKMNFQIDGFKISGNVEVQGQAQDLDIELGNSFIMDGAALDTYLSLIDLPSSDKTILRVFNAQKQKLEVLKIHLDGKEQIEGYPCQKVNLMSADNTELIEEVWISEHLPRTLIKKTKRIPEMNGARLTMALRHRE